MAGELKLNGVSVATESNGSVQIVNTKIQLNQNDDTVIDSSGNSVISESSGQVTFDSVAIENSTLKLTSSGITIQDSNGNSLIEESNGVVTIGGNSTIVIGQNTTIPSAAGGMPPGCIMSFGMATPPDGWLVCDGSEYSTSSYSDLYTAIGETWGSLTDGSGGAGTSHFRVPDLRGEFLRGWSNGTGNDPDSISRTGGDVVGSSQDYEIQSHRHDGRFVGFYYSTGTLYRAFYNAAGLVDDASPLIGNTGGNETRPRNKYVQYCIKY